MERGREWRLVNHLSRSTLKYFFRLYYVPGPEHCEGHACQDGLNPGVKAVEIVVSVANLVF